jgi:hypothetical protein
VTVTVNGDLTNEANETFSVNLTLPLNATIAHGQGVGTITNDDPVPSLSVSDVTVTEGNGGTSPAAFVISLSSPSGQTVSVGYATADGSATAGSDYVTTFGTLTIPPGSAGGTASVDVVGDLAYEPNESFLLNLSAPLNATLLDDQGTGTITNDDSPPTVSIGDVVVPRGPSGTTTAVFPVTLSAATYQTVGVDFSTADGTATAGTDYVATSGGLSIPPGTTTGAINVAVNGSAGPGGKTFFVNLASPTNAGLGDAQGRATLTVAGQAFYAVAPCRVVDTRNAAQGAPALVANTSRSFAIAGSCGVPATAKAVSVNVTVTGPTGSGDLRLYPSGTTLPLVSAINYAAGRTRANSAVVALGTGALTARCDQAVGTVHFILDVNGYFE